MYTEPERRIVLCVAESYPEFTAELQEKKNLLQSPVASTSQKPDKGEGETNQENNVG